MVSIGREKGQGVSNTRSINPSPPSMLSYPKRISCPLYRRHSPFQEFCGAEGHKVWQRMRERQEIRSANSNQDPSAS